VFAFTEMPLGQSVKLQLGARAEHSDTKGTPITGIAVERSFTPFSGSASFVIPASGALTFGVTLASAARVPNVTELFAIGPHDGPATYEIGDPTLGIERSNSLEVTVRFNGSGFTAAGALWGASFDNYIYGDLTGRTCDEFGACAFGSPDELKEMFYRQQSAEFWGMEAKADIPLMQDDDGTLTTQILADYVRATLADGTNVPRITPYRIGGGFSWESPAFDANVRLTYSGPRNSVATAETPTADFISLDAGLSWRPGANAKGFEFSLIGKNLTDTVQRNAVALNKDTVVLPGRDIRLVARYAF